MAQVESENLFGMRMRSDPVPEATLPHYKDPIPGLVVDAKTDLQFVDHRAYERRLPPQFAPPTFWEHLYDSNRIPHDELMYKVITNLAREGKDDMGRPNGRFYVDKATALKFVAPLVKHKVKFATAEEYEFYMKDRVVDIFNHMDVLNSGYIEAEQMGRFIKEACQDHTMMLY